MKNELSENGFVIIPEVYTSAEINSILGIISKSEHNSPTFRKTKDLFAIRQFLKEVPEAVPVIVNENLKNIIREFFGSSYFIVKSIYFDKPGASNWFVAYHQDLTISVDKKTDIEGFGPWTVKQDQFAVQPPVDILENNFTIRIHLDDTNELNGALKVIPGSHLKKIYRPETIDWSKETENSYCVRKGGIMIMKPLLLHASDRTINNSNRRVVHIELSDAKLPPDIQWSEKLEVLN